MSGPNKLLPFLPLQTARLKIRAYRADDLAVAKPLNQGAVRIMKKIGTKREGAFRQCNPRPDGTGSN